MNRAVLFGCLLIMIALASAQAQTATPVTLDELIGLGIEGKLVMQQEVLRQGKRFKRPVMQEMSISFAQDHKIHGALSVTSVTGKGPHKTKLVFTAKLDQAGSMGEWLGAGHYVWFFANGTLTNLRIFKQGANKREITFTRNPTGLSCSIRNTLAREAGRGDIELKDIEMKSAVDDVPITLLKLEQVSSSCKVVKAKASS